MVHCGIFTGGKGAVVAACTTAGHAGVIKHAAGEAGGDVTHRAIFAGRDVSGRFARGIGSIVAGRAVIHDARVIEHGL